MEIKLSTNICEQIVKKMWLIIVIHRLFHIIHSRCGKLYKKCKQEIGYIKK